MVLFIKWLLHFIKRYGIGQIKKYPGKTGIFLDF